MILRTCIMLTLALCICIFLSLVVASRDKMEGYIVGGAYALIYKYPHVAYLGISCVIEDGDRPEYGCGSSLINQKILLTAGHCLFDCTSKTSIVIRMGHEDNGNGTLRSSSGYLIHADYDDVSCVYDIALVRMSRPVKFNSRISRVAIMEWPPYSEPAHLAGWGLSDVLSETIDRKLKEVDQKVWKHALCAKMFNDMPKGTICASSKNPNDYPARGDSGSGLVVRGYIQIGLVSYKIVRAQHIIIYTDVGYYYDWIVYNTWRLNCFIDNY